MRSPNVRWTLLFLGLVVLILAPLPLLEPAIAATLNELHSPVISRPMVGSAVLVLLALDVFIPVPSSVVATLAGHRLGFLAGALSIWLGLNLGCLAGFLVGRKLGSSGLVAWLGEAEVNRARGWVEGEAGWAGLASTRAVPVFSEAAVLLAGALRVQPGRVAWVCALGNAGVAVVYAGLGAVAAELELMVVAVAGSVLLPLIAAGVLTGVRRLG